MSDLQEPTPPPSSLLHLGITAYTHCIPDYCLLHNDFNSFHIDYQSLMAGVEFEQERGSAKERAIVSSILSQMIR